jgi:hypothetical protein
MYIYILVRFFIKQILLASIDMPRKDMDFGFKYRWSY